jgi:hypothetical protein
MTVVPDLGYKDAGNQAYEAAVATAANLDVAGFMGRIHSDAYPGSTVVFLDSEVCAPFLGESVDASTRQSFVDAMVAFAEDTSVASPLARITALERAMEGGFAERELDIPNTDKETLRVAAHNAGFGAHNPERYKQARAYTYIDRVLLERENIDFEVHFRSDTWEEQEMGIFSSTTNPVLAYAYLEQLDTELQTDDPSADAIRFAPLITDLKSELALAHGLPENVQANWQDWPDIGICKGLLSFGDHYKGELAGLINSRNPESMQYVRQVGDIYRLTEGVAWAFPKRYREGVKMGIKNLLADALYAVNYHLSAGSRTDVELPLHSGKGALPLQLEGTEPLELLSLLEQTFTSLRGAWLYSNQYNRPAHAIKAVDSENFAMYRFLDYETGEKKILPYSLYVRPYGSTSFDSKLEYGRLGEGVEASISYVVDTGLITNDRAAEDLIELGKHRGDDDARISIRLDREGVKSSDRGMGVQKDPTQKEGTLSLDVGSVLGRDDWQSTKLGRLLAWGNVLRTRALGAEAQLNHITEYFTEEDGDADVFALQAARMIEQIDANILKTNHITWLFAGRSALDGTRQ